MFIIIIPIFIMFVINFLIVKQFFLLFFGSLEIYFSINEISINSKFMSINKYKYYQLDEISDIWVDDSFVLKKINKIPLFGQIFFQLISSTNPDNKSIMIKYKGKVIILLNNLTREKVVYITSKIREVYIDSTNFSILK
jgi:hypothetical protein